MLLTCRSIVRSLSTSSAAIDLFVVPRESMSSGRLRTRRERVHSRGVRSRRQPGEHAASGVQLPRGGVLVPHCPAPEPYEDADACGLVGRFELLPCLLRLTKS